MSDRFHSKYHRQNHHTNPDPTDPDASHDPIASKEAPFQGDFFINGSLSATVLSAARIALTEAFAVNDLDVNGILRTTNSAYFNGTVYTKNLNTINAYISGDATVTGNFTVLGSAAYLSVSNLAVDDNLIYFGQENVGNTLDLGIVSHLVAPLNNSVTKYQHSGLVRRSNQGSPGTWTLFSGVTTEPLTAANISWGDRYTQVDNLSANLLGNVTTSNGNSDQWNATYTITRSNSSTFNTVSSLSGRWNSVYSYVSANSANWNTISVFQSQSANNVSVYSTMSSNSANWNSISFLQAFSANNISVYSSVSANSGNWNLITSLPAISGGNASVYTTVQTYSANWNNSYSWVYANTARGTFSVSVSAPALSGTFYGDGSKLTNIVGYLPLSGGTLTGPVSSPSNVIVANNFAVQNQIQYLSAGVVKVYQYYNSSTNSLDTVFM